MVTASLFEYMAFEEILVLGKRESGQFLLEHLVSTVSGNLLKVYLQSETVMFSSVRLFDKVVLYPNNCIFMISLGIFRKCKNLSLQPFFALCQGHINHKRSYE